jgi:Ca2+-binding EF-hand superfamily protein
MTIASKHITPEQLKQSWQVFDSHPNGMLSLAEIDLALRYHSPEIYKEKAAIMRAYKASDTSKDGFITKEEFPAFVDLLMEYHKLFKLFAQLDTNRDKRISLIEFKKDHELLGVTCKDYKAEFDRIDTNHGGWILFDEFCIYMANKQLKQ